MDYFEKPIASGTQSQTLIASGTQWAILARKNELQTMKMGKYVTTFLTADDMTEPKLLTIHEVKEEKVASEARAVMYFEEIESGCILNKTCIKKLVELFDSDDSTDWIGNTVVVFNDPSVEFRGEKVGGIRFRAPKNGAATKPAKSKSRAGAAAASGGTGEGSDDVPF